MVGALGGTSGKGGRDVTAVAIRLLSEVARSPAFQARVRRMAGQAARRKRNARGRSIDVKEVGTTKATSAARSRGDSALALRMRLRRLRSMVHTLDEAVGEQPEARRALDATSQALDGLKLHLRLATKLPTEKRQAELAAIASEAGRLEDGVLALLDELKTAIPRSADADTGGGASA
jgi:hypothetical protein